MTNRAATRVMLAGVGQQRGHVVTGAATKVAPHDGVGLAPAGASPSPALADAPFAAVRVDLATRRIRDASGAMLALLGLERGALLGLDAAQFLLGSPSPALPLLVSGRIEGYEQNRQLRFPDGREQRVHIWTHALGTERPARSALIVVDELPAGEAGSWGSPRHHVTVLGTVDNEWRVDRVSVEVAELLGYPPDRVLDRPLLGVIHPGDLADFLTGLGHAQRQGESVIVRLRLRAADGCWRWCRACLAKLAGSTGFAFMLVPAADEPDAAAIAGDLRARLSRIAYEAQAASTLARVGELPPPGKVPGLESLTAREWQIVSALQSGARGAEIARTLHLAPSTVRNHLVSVYRKLGVQSQVGLLSVLQRSGL